jgi:hypothetical protein
MASSPDLPLSEWKKLAYSSGNRCAFPKCGKYLYVPGEDGQGDLTLAEAAHIIGSSRQGPRGDIDIPASERDRSARNRILLCGEHHKYIDQRPRAFPVQVLRKIKEDHERRALPPIEERPQATSATETLRATVLPVVGLPSLVMSLPLQQQGMSEGDVARAMRWPPDRSVTVPFLVRDNRIYTFSNLMAPEHPFVDLVTQGHPERVEAEQLWNDPEGHRRYVALLNKALTKHLQGKRLRFDPEHRRYWFLPEGDREVRVVEYHTKQRRAMKKEVVRRRIRRATGEAKEWVHVAAGLRFDQVTKAGWVLTLRPEFQFTSDGRTPLSPKQQGAKSTRKKSHLYNEQYLDLVHFWVDFLANGSQYLVIKAADQRIRVLAELQPHPVSWPGVPEDYRPYTPKPSVDGGLLALLDEMEAAEQLDLDDSWFADEEAS